jgi:hypothetical protein
MIHYHGTPITPLAALKQLKGRNFCVSHAWPGQVSLVHKIGQSVLLDNGAYSFWKKGRETDWPSYYAWCEIWLNFPTTWAIIPDVIDGGSQLQDALVREWPFGHRGAPVWHMDEPIHRLLALCDTWPKVCIGSTAEYRNVLSDVWRRRMDECWNAIVPRHKFLPWIHMLRGLQCSGLEWPFASADSTNLAQSHWRPENTPYSVAERLDAVQCPGSWTSKATQLELI